MESNEQEIVKALPESNWYQFTLDCGHIVYSRVRLRYEKPGRQAHRVRCPQCQEANKKLPKNQPVPLTFALITDVKVATDAEVSNVLSGTAFVLPRSIMRFDTNGGPNGNPFPYSTREREY